MNINNMFNPARVDMSVSIAAKYEGKDALEKNTTFLALSFHVGILLSGSSALMRSPCSASQAVLASLASGASVCAETATIASPSRDMLRSELDVVDARSEWRSECAC